MSGNIDADELKRMLNKNNRKSDLLDRMEYRKPPGKATVRREVKTPDGEIIYIEDRQITVNPYSAQQEHIIVQISHKCECCGMPVTGEMLALDLIRPCTSCQKKTCPRCRINTNLHEFLKPEVRGQTVCNECWNRFAHELIVHCPNCKQPVKNHYDIKTCNNCEDKICPACGISLPSGGLICSRCFREREASLEAAEYADSIFGNALGRVS
jgi:hypothetical protein